MGTRLTRTQSQEQTIIINSKLIKIMKTTKKTKQAINYGLVVLMILFNSLGNPLAATAQMPTPPTKPSAPESPSAPEAPPAPKAPEAPSVSSKEPEPTPASTPKPKKDKVDQEAVVSENSSSQNPSSPSTNNSESQKSSDIATGDATANASATTIAGSNTNTSPVSDTLAPSIANSGNGEESVNTNSVAKSDNTQSVQVNKADVANGVALGTSTGKNNNSQNLGDSSTKTGNANTVATIITNANTNINGVTANEFNVVDDYTGDILLDPANACTGCGADGAAVLVNSNNGANSDNSNEMSNSTNSNNFASNDAVVGNEIILTAETGGNKANENTGGEVSIQTGDASVIANVASFLNNNILGKVVVNTVNIFGNLVGDIVASNSSSCSDCGQTQNLAMSNNDNGAMADTANSYDSSDNSLVYQQNNAVIDNQVDIKTATGNNDVSKNTGGESSVSTGDSNVSANVVNVANQNVAGDWWIVLVNQAGQWIGTIVGSPDSRMAGSQGTEFRVNDSAQVEVSNSNNGAYSTNTNQVNSDTSSNQVQTNQADLVNNIQINASTGGNEASKNTGGSSKIETGDVNVMVNLINFINNNIVGSGKVNITLVNVFGSWIGDFVPQGQTKQVKVPDMDQDTHENTQAIGGLVQERQIAAETQTSEQTETSKTQLTSSTQETGTQIGRQAVVTRQLQTRFLSYQNQVASTTTSSVDEENVLGIKEADQTQTSTKRQVRITWPAFVSSLLGVTYLALKSRGLLAA